MEHGNATTPSSVRVEQIIHHGDFWFVVNDSIVEFLYNDQVRGWTDEEIEQFFRRFVAIVSPAATFEFALRDWSELIGHLKRSEDLDSERDALEHILGIRRRAEQAGHINEVAAINNGTTTENDVVLSHDQCASDQSPMTSAASPDEDHRMHTVATPKDVANPDLLRAFGGLPHYRTARGRASCPDGYDPLSTEGPHRSVWRLTGYECCGTTSDARSVYVLRFAVNDTAQTTYHAATIGDHAPLLVHAYDDQPASQRTYAAAVKKARELLAS